MLVRQGLRRRLSIMRSRIRLCSTELRLCAYETVGQNPEFVVDPDGAAVARSGAGLPQSAQVLAQPREFRSRFLPQHPLRPLFRSPAMERLEQPLRRRQCEILQPRSFRQSGSVILHSSRRGRILWGYYAKLHCVQQDRENAGTRSNPHTPYDAADNFCICVALRTAREEIDSERASFSG